MFLRELERLPKEKPTDERLAPVELAWLGNECVVLACKRLQRGDRRGYARAATRALEFGEAWAERFLNCRSREEYFWGGRNENE